MSKFWNIFFGDQQPKKRATKRSSRSRGLWDVFFCSEDPAREVPTARKFQEDKLFWAMRNMPVSDAPLHFLISGTIGSGKTTSIKLFLQSIAPRFKPGRAKPEQLIVFDAKQDIVPYLASLGFRPEDPNVWLMNPFDERSSVWNIAEAVQEPAMARYLATLLFPKEENSSAPYFSNAAREVAYAMITALNSRKGGNWTLRDLLCALDSPEHVVGVTAHDFHAKRHARQFIRDKKHFPGVLSTNATRLGQFAQVAALWHNKRLNGASPRMFSITEFLKKPGVLVLGYDPVLNDSLWPINAMLLKALTNEILRSEDTGEPRHWFVLDEFRAMEKVECMPDLLNRGRSKGASVLLGIQSFEGITKVYESSGAHEITGLCANKTWLRVSSETAKWAEEYFNKVRSTERVITEQWSTSGPSVSVQYQVQDRPLFQASMFSGIPFPKQGWFSSINDVASLNAPIIVGRPFPDVTSWITKPLSKHDCSPLKKRRLSDQKLHPWDETEEKYFCREGATDELNNTDFPKAAKKRKGSGRLPNRSSFG